MSNHLICSIKIPTVIYTNSGSADDIDNSPYIRFDIATPEFDGHQEFLALDEAQKITDWLAESINYIENTEETETPSINHHKALVKILTSDRLEEGRMWLVGQLTVETEDKIEPSILVDVVQDANSIWIRLIIIKDIILSCWFSIAAAKDLINGFSSAIAHLNQNSPWIISNFIIGRVEALTTNGQNRWIDIELEGAVEQGNVTSAIMINILAREDGKGFLSTWWFNDGEALKLNQLLENSLSVVEEERLENTEEILIGYLGEFEKESWLTVTVSRNLPMLKPEDSLNRYYWVKLNFNDELVMENPDNSKLCLTTNRAKELSQLLLTVIQNKSDYTPHIYLPPQPNNLVIAELYF